jgi:G:T-mismatch repair DNA endonuclease (very short patch repair protein)
MSYHADMSASAMGWSVLVVWQCAISADASKMAITAVEERAMPSYA